MGLKIGNATGGIPFLREQSLLFSDLLRNRKKVTYSNVISGYGHDAFLLEVDTLSRMIKDFLANQMLEVQHV